ncbi:MAG: hypothetical protein M1825_003522 [Sarcosagium campestre]|nr:MAG: hypothetical protein M1825_003522 [Sarcosagium campestre]
MPKNGGPQAFLSSYGPRLKAYNNSLLTPITQAPTNQLLPNSRTTKRGTLAINYAEDMMDDDDFIDSDRPSRLTGLRSLRRDEGLTQDKSALEYPDREVYQPIQVQGNWREWMGKPAPGRTTLQAHAQTVLPYTPVPIRVELDIPASHPDPAFPLPGNAHELGINPSLPVFRRGDAAPPFRLREAFIWNLHEALMTPDQFAINVVNDLDLPNKMYLAQQFSGQIRQQLEEYAGVALHPLFHSSHGGHAPGNAAKHHQLTNGTKELSVTPAATNAPTPIANGGGAAITNGHWSTKLKNGEHSHHPAGSATEDPDANNPDDAYRCVISLDLILGNKHYTDKFEWSLIHPPGYAEKFARTTCADIGLPGEWVSTICHGIYEAVLKLKKEACESGGLVGGGKIENQTYEGREAGWRYDPEHLCAEWGPRVEILSKEEIEKREGDRERQIRRLRRETARFSSSTGLLGGVPQGTPGALFDNPEHSEAPMGRGERSKKKRRLNQSPNGRANTPGGRGTPDTGAAGGYGGGSGLSEMERLQWRCSHCLTWGNAVWEVRAGPMGPRSLCNNCGLLYERDKKLPPWLRALHRKDYPISR